MGKNSFLIGAINRTPTNLEAAKNRPSRFFSRSIGSVFSFSLKSSGLNVNNRILLHERVNENYRENFQLFTRLRGDWNFPLRGFGIFMGIPLG